MSGQNSSERKLWSLMGHSGELDEETLAMLIAEAVHMWMRGCCHMSMGSKKLTYIIEQKEMADGYLGFHASVSVCANDQVSEVTFFIKETYLKEQHAKKYRLRGEHARYNV